MPQTPEIPVLTLDGPSGTGKGTVGRIVAARLGWHYLDSGAVYRAFALIADEQRLSPQDTDKLAEFSRNLSIDFGPDPATPGVFCNGRNLTEEIRSERCGELASRFAAVNEVRVLLLNLQRGTRRRPGLVADGRDMGTTVFPDALVKIFLDAATEVRAERRYKQLKEKGFDVSLARLRQDMAERDARDSSRAVSPLVMAPDAIRIDTSEMTVEEVVVKVLRIVSSRIDDSFASRAR